MFPFTCLYFLTLIRLLICAPTNTGAHLLLDELIKSRMFKKTVLKRIVSVNYYNSPFHNTEYDEYYIDSNQDLKKYGKKKSKHFFLLSVFVDEIY